MGMGNTPCTRVTVDQLLMLTMAAYNLTRLRTLAQLRPQSA